jgi:DNA-binding MarR family transcriptional regulator
VWQNYNSTVRIRRVETFAGLGTRMRHVLELLDGDVGGVYADLGVTDYRPRFSPVVRALVALGPLSIRDLAGAIGVTHSAASQTAAQMARDGLLTLEPGADARQRIARLTDRARDLLPLIEAEWAATDAAAAELEAELPAALGDILMAAERAVVSRPMRTRIADAARMLRAALPAGDDSVPVAARRAALRAIAGDDPGAPDSGSPRLPAGDAG